MVVDGKKQLILSLICAYLVLFLFCTKLLRRLCVANLFRGENSRMRNYGDDDSALWFSSSFLFEAKTQSSTSHWIGDDVGTKC